MKKIISFLTLTVVMLAGLAGNALAYIEAGSLIRVVYQTNGNVEVLTDLGNGANLIASTNAHVGTGANAFSLSQFAGATFADLRVAYLYAPTISSTGSMSLSGSQNAKSDVRKGNMLSSNFTSFTSLYRGDASTVVGSKSNPLSFFSKMTTTNYGGFLNKDVVEMNLAELATAGYVEQTLYTFANINVASTGLAVAIIRTLADGSTIINPAAVSQVPVPASLLLFGTGLLGLFGIRRKNA